MHEDGSGVATPFEHEDRGVVLQRALLVFQDRGDQASERFGQRQLVGLLAYQQINEPIRAEKVALGRPRLHDTVAEQHQPVTRLKGDFGNRIVPGTETQRKTGI